MRKGKKSNMAKKKPTEKALNIDSILFNCRDYLRAARNSGSFFEKRDIQWIRLLQMDLLSLLNIIHVLQKYLGLFTTVDKAQLR